MTIKPNYNQNNIILRVVDGWCPLTSPETLVGVPFPIQVCDGRLVKTTIEYDIRRGVQIFERKILVVNGHVAERKRDVIESIMCVPYLAITRRLGFAISSLSEEYECTERTSNPSDLARGFDHTRS